ncbi:pyridoxamine 5'-phosphate oxidase family protein [Mycolicibacterium sp. GESEQ-9]|uniref:pyridoxamine 5'-phosphate oxidase family protein n=1 Tax=Mycolicibacterium sp. GESEQ-9 TaxID=2812656 RepID=UPI001B33CEFC|nr:pyridoxamine 5'-phosphate oxidase family protein [Mycolicibacterium sp. GESEQ-9]
MIDSSSAARLDSADFGWITTVRHDGQPQSSYVWFHFDGTDVFVISEPQSGKVRNITENPRVSFHLDGDGTIGDGVLTIDGAAELSSAIEHQQRLSQYMSKYEHRIRAGLESTPERYAANFSTAIKIGFETIRAW